MAEENDNFEECECVKRLGTSKKHLYVRQLPVLFMLSHTCTVSFFLLLGEENDLRFHRDPVYPPPLNRLPLRTLQYLARLSKMACKTVYLEAHTLSLF